MAITAAIHPDPDLQPDELLTQPGIATPPPLLTPSQPLQIIPPINHTPLQLALYAWPSTPENAVLKHYGTGPKPDAAKMTKEDSSPQQAPPSGCATTGTTEGDAPPARMTNAMNAQDAETRIMELRGVFELRKNKALTPYNPDAWEKLLRQCNLLVKYQNLPRALRKALMPEYDPYTVHSHHLIVPACSHIQTTTKKLLTKNRGRYMDLCTCQEVESLIGPFQSSPLSLIPKPSKFRAIHNFSCPHTPTSTFSSINYTIDADMYPCTWGTSATICFTINNPPPACSQASILDVAEAYRTITITPNQWTGLVVKLCEEDRYAINTCKSFGLTSAGGIHGEVGDATTDIFRAHGIGPLSK